MITQRTCTCRPSRSSSLQGFAPAAKLPQLRKQLHMMHAKLRNTTKRCTWPPENELLLPIYTAFSRRTGPSCLQGLMMINDYNFLARLLDTILLDLGILPLFDSCLLTYSKLSKTGDCSKSPASWRQRCHSTVCWWHCTLAYHPTDVSSRCNPLWGKRQAWRSLVSRLASHPQSWSEVPHQPAERCKCSLARETNRIVAK